MNLLGRSSITIFMIIAAIIITFGTTPLIKSDLVFAASGYQSGFNHGVSDASKDPSNWYILQPGKGFQFHTQAFDYGYVAGFCSIKSISSDADEAIFDCARGPSSAAWVTK